MTALGTLGPATPIGPLPAVKDHVRERVVNHAVPMLVLGGAAGAVVDGLASRAGMTGHGPVHGAFRGAAVGALGLGVPAALHATGAAGMQSLVAPRTERQANTAALIGTGLAGAVVGGVLYRNAAIGVAGGAAIGAATGAGVEFGMQHARDQLG